MATTAAHRSACSIADVSRSPSQLATRSSHSGARGLRTPSAFAPLFMGRKLQKQKNAKTHGRICMAGGMTSSGNILLPPFDDAYLHLAKKYGSAKFPASYAPQMGAASPAQVERGGGGSSGQHKSRRPPPDLPSLLINSRIVYIGMPVSFLDCSFSRNIFSLKFWVLQATPDRQVHCANMRSFIVNLLWCSRRLG